MLRWTSAGGDRRRAHPPRDVQPFAAFLGHDVPVISPAELRGLGVHRGPPPRLAPRRLPGHVGDRRRGRPASCGPASASSTPTTAASTRPPTSAASASTTTPSCAPPTASSATCSTSCPPGAVLLVTADHGQVDVGDNIVDPAAELLDLVAQQSGEGRFRWWHARHGAADDLRQGGRRALRGRRLGRHQGAGDRRAAGSARRSPRPIAARLGDVALVPFAPGHVLRPRRLRAVRAGLPARLADAGRGARAAARRHAVDRSALPRRDTPMQGCLP